MPYAPPRPCSRHGQILLQGNVKCPICEQSRKDKARAYDKQRGHASDRGYTTKWRTESREFLKQYPLCVSCKGKANTVDHKIPHKGDKRLFWDKSNWQSMCHSCHSIKTDKFDGGFGHG